MVYLHLRVGNAPSESYVVTRGQPTTIITRPACVFFCVHPKLSHFVLQQMFYLSITVCCVKSMIRESTILNLIKLKLSRAYPSMKPHIWLYSSSSLAICHSFPYNYMHIEFDIKLNFFRDSVFLLFVPPLISKVYAIKKVGLPVFGPFSKWPPLKSVNHVLCHNLSSKAVRVTKLVSIHMFVGARNSKNVSVL